MESGESYNDIENPKAPLIESMKSEFEKLCPLTSGCNIYRVPERLRQVNERAYTPQVVSIGPLHHGKESLRPMEEHKTRFLWAYMNRTGSTLEHYVNAVRSKEEQIRGCYAEPLGRTSDELVKIVLVDAAFLIELLLRNHFEEFQDDHDRIFKKPWMLQDICPDLWLLENQLPFFIVETLYEPEKISFRSESGKTLPILHLLHNFFKEPLHLKGTEKNLDQISHVAHFVDFLRNMFIPIAAEADDDAAVRAAPSKALLTPPVTELHRAGVKLRAAETENLFGIAFANGVLSIPRLTISDEMELTVRNALAFEQCHCEGQNYLNDYAIMMDRLVNTAKDVDLLVKCGIFENRLGDSNEAATLMNKLGDGTTFDSANFYFATVSSQLDRYCKTSWHKWRANLRQKYFNTPWSIVSVIAAVLIILLTITQAVCSVISVANNKDSPPH